MENGSVWKAADVYSVKNKKRKKQPCSLLGLTDFYDGENKTFLLFFLKTFFFYLRRKTHSGKIVFSPFNRKSYPCALFIIRQHKIKVIKNKTEIINLMDVNIDKKFFSPNLFLIKHFRNVGTFRQTIRKPLLFKLGLFMSNILESYKYFSIQNSSVHEA